MKRVTEKSCCRGRRDDLTTGEKIAVAPDKVVCGQAEKCEALGPDSRGQKGARGTRRGQSSADIVSFFSGKSSVSPGHVELLHNMVTRWTTQAQMCACMCAWHGMCVRAAKRVSLPIIQPGIAMLEHVRGSPAVLLCVHTVVADAVELHH